MFSGLRSLLRSDEKNWVNREYNNDLGFNEDADEPMDDTSLVHGVDTNNHLSKRSSQHRKSDLHAHVIANHLISKFTSVAHSHEKIKVVFVLKGDENIHAKRGSSQPLRSFQGLEGPVETPCTLNLSENMKYCLEHLMGTKKTKSGTNIAE